MDELELNLHCFEIFLMFSKPVFPIFEIFFDYGIFNQNWLLIAIILICSPCQSFRIVLGNISYISNIPMAKNKAFLRVTDITKRTNKPLKQAKTQNIHKISG